jgi:putative sporulation protein YtxC
VKDMQFLCIGVKGSGNTVLQMIDKELQQIKDKKIDFSVEEVDSEGDASIICSINGGKLYREKSLESYKVFVEHISNALADYIIDQYEEKLLKRIINNNYCYFSSSERKEIFAKAVSIIKNEDKSFINNLLKIKRKNIILQSLLDYFDSSNNIILDGFVNFRLKEYLKSLEEISDKAVDDFIIEREYKEFVRLLRYFVEIQEPKIDTVHVIVNYENKYTLLDESKREITNECIQEYANEISGGEINYDDLLVSSLITFAPKNVIIHGEEFKNKELLETIKNVFPGKVLFCPGCNCCLANVIKSKDN